MTQPIDPPTDLQADDALRALHDHAGLLLEPHIRVVAAHVNHLRNELKGVLEINDWQHQELLEKDAREAATTTTTNEAA